MPEILLIDGESVNCFAFRSGKRVKGKKKPNTNKTTKIEEVIVTDMFFINLQHSVTVLGDKTESESSLRSYGQTSPDTTEIHMNVLGDWLGVGLGFRLQSPKFECN